MNGLSYPLSVTRGRFLRYPGEKSSIDASLELLISTPLSAFSCDPDYGFVLNNLKFEVVNEAEGVIANFSPESNYSGLTGEIYDRKISGTSKSLNTFAEYLKKSVEKYEKRISNVRVSMTYIRAERKVAIVVKGTLAGSEEPYEYTTAVSLWNK